MSNNDYVIFIKKKRGDFEPVDSAETKDEGIEVAKAYLENPKVLEAEVVYMPEDDYDIEETVWNSSKNIDESLNEKNTGVDKEGEALVEDYKVKFGYDTEKGEKSFNSLEDAINFINDSIKKKDAESLVLVDADGKEMIWLDHYRDRDFHDVGYTVSRHNDKSIEFDKTKKGLVIKQPEGPKDDKLTRDILVSAIFKKKAYSVAQALNKFKFIIDNNKPTQIDFNNNTVYYNEKGDYTDHAADTLISQYKTKTEAFKESMDVSEVELTKENLVTTYRGCRVFETPSRYVVTTRDGTLLSSTKTFEGAKRVVDNYLDYSAEAVDGSTYTKKFSDDSLQELFGLGKKKEKKNLYIMAMGRDSSGRLFTGDVWTEIMRILRNHLDSSSINSNSNRNYFGRVVDQCEFTTTEIKFNRIKHDINFFVSDLHNKPRYFTGYDYVNGKGESNPDIKRSAENLIKFECLKRDIKESLEESEDDAWSEEEVRAELIKMTNNFKKNEGEITTWYEEEKDHIKDILEAASYQVEISDGRKNKEEDMNWVITFVKKVNESLTENSDAKLSLELIDNDEDNMVAAYKVSSGKDALSLAVETIGYESDFKVHKKDIKKLEIVSSLSEGNDITDVFIDIDENKDLIYCGKFNSGDYTNIDKIIKVIEDWSKGAIVEESLKESKIMSLEDILNSPGSTDMGNLELLLQKNGYKVTSKKLVNSTNIGTNIPRYKNVYELSLDNGKKVISVQHYDSNNIEDGFDNPKPYVKESLKESRLSAPYKYKGCKVQEHPNVWVATAEDGLTIGSSRTRVGAEALIDDYLDGKYERVGSSHLSRKTDEDTNINIDKVEIDVDTLNTKTKKIDEDLAFDKDKKLTIREMYDFLLKSGMANGCDIILDWDNDSDLSDPKTAIEWLDLIIETYYDLDSDLRYMNANDEAERNMDQVIVPLEDFRNELNEKGLMELNNIFYSVITHNDDMGNDDEFEYDNFGDAENDFEETIEDYKKRGVDGSVELYQVDGKTLKTTQLKYWSSEDDNAWKFDEGLSKSHRNYQTAYEKLDKFMSDSEEDIYKFYEARTKEDLLNVLENAIVDEDRFLSYAGENATLEGFAEYILDNKLNESIQEEETVKDYGCDMCGKRVPEDQVFWFYGGEIGLCEECYDETSTYVKARLDDGDFSFLDKEY